MKRDKHRVWGGSYVGFAKGLTLAPVDWDGDGDVDMVCGTSDGKLALLRDPGVGRPTNLRAAAGVDTVVLDWDPNGQSRVYGYKAYRAASETEAFGEIAETALPTYRDTPPNASAWAYQVTALSRLWTAGNSKPEEFESAPSDVVSASLGDVELSLPETMTSYDAADITVPIRINNSKGVAAKDLSLTLMYDATKLTPTKLEKSALTDGLTLTSTIENGVWRIASTGGEMLAGADVLFKLHFDVAKGAFGDTPLALTDATLFSLKGAAIGHNALPVTTVLTVVEREDPADTGKILPWQNGDCDGNKYLDWNDYREARRVIIASKGVVLNGGSDKKIYRSIQEALGLDRDVVLTLDKHLPLFYQYISEHYGEGKKK